MTEAHHLLWSVGKEGGGFILKIKINKYINNNQCNYLNQHVNLYLD